MTLPFMRSRSSVDRAPARCLGSHGFDFCRGLRFFLCSMVVSHLLDWHNEYFQLLFETAAHTTIIALFHFLIVFFFRDTLTVQCNRQEIKKEINVNKREVHALALLSKSVIRGQNPWLWTFKLKLYFTFMWDCFIVNMWDVSLFDASKC